MMLAIKGLGRFNQVDPFTSVEGPEGNEILEPSPRGLKELRKAMKEYKDQMGQLDREETDQRPGGDRAD